MTDLLRLKQLMTTKEPTASRFNDSQGNYAKDPACVANVQVTIDGQVLEITRREYAALPINDKQRIDTAGVSVRML